MTGYFMPFFTALALTTNGDIVCPFPVVVQANAVARHWLASGLGLRQYRIEHPGVRFDVR